MFIANLVIHSDIKFKGENSISKLHLNCALLQEVEAQRDLIHESTSASREYRSAIALAAPKAKRELTRA